MTDTIRLLWLTSDPAINKERQKGLPLCKKCLVRGHSGRYCGQQRQHLSATDIFILFLIYEYKNFVIFLEYKRQYLFMDYSIFKALLKINAFD